MRTQQHERWGQYGKSPHWSTAPLPDYDAALENSKILWEKHTGLPYELQVGDPLPAEKSLMLVWVRVDPKQDIKFWDELDYYFATQGRFNDWIDDGMLLDVLINHYKKTLLVLGENEGRGIHEAIYRQGYSYGFVHRQI
jgi:hypothetical protein